MRAQLRSLPESIADNVARHLVMADRIFADDPERGYRYAVAAREIASRVAAVRAFCGVVAYRTGRWADALSELRAARRMSGEDTYLPLMADAERGLGRPERALELARAPEADRLERAERIELRIVESGARRDLGQYDAAVVALQVRELKDPQRRPWTARLYYAYADALLDAGREDDARLWFARAAEADRDGETDAHERFTALEGADVFDAESDEVDILDAESDDPTADPLTDEPTPESPTDEPTNDATTAQPAPARSAGEPSADEPADDRPADDASSEAPANAPSARESSTDGPADGVATAGSVGGPSVDEPVAGEPGDGVSPGESVGGSSAGEADVDASGGDAVGPSAPRPQGAEFASPETASHEGSAEPQRTERPEVAGGEEPAGDRREPGPQN